jgi:hypothetical protein
MVTCAMTRLAELALDVAMLESAIWMRSTVNPNQTMA